MRAIVRAMVADPSLGVVMARHWPPLREWINIGANYRQMKQILAGSTSIFRRIRRSSIRAGQCTGSGVLRSRN